MSDKKESKFNLDSFQKIIYITVAIVVLLSGFFATYTRSLLQPIKQDQKYVNKEINKINTEINVLDASVDKNSHSIAIINSRIRNIN